MLAAVVLTVVADEDWLLPFHIGRAHYAAALRRLSHFEGKLAASIHDADPKPMTCSNLLGGQSGPDGLSVRAGHSYRLRITGLTTAVSEALIQYFVNEPPATIELDKRAFRVVRAACDEAIDRWSGCCTYDALVRRHMVEIVRPSRMAALEFASPTSFKSKGLNVPLPLPNLVFGSLVERWNAFSPLVLDSGLRQYYETQVAVSRYKLETRSVKTKNDALRIGGIGVVTYTAMTKDKYALAALQLLTDYAFYSGVGAQTATGMGQARRVVDGDRQR